MFGLNDGSAMRRTLYMPLPKSALPEELTGDFDRKTTLGHESDEIAGNHPWTGRLQRHEGSRSNSLSTVRSAC